MKVLRSLLEAAWASAVLRLGLEPMPGPRVPKPAPAQGALEWGQPVSWKVGQAQAGGLGPSPALTSCAQVSALRLPCSPHRQLNMPECESLLFTTDT